MDSVTIKYLKCKDEPDVEALYCEGHVSISDFSEAVQKLTGRRPPEDAGIFQHSMMPMPDGTLDDCDDDAPGSIPVTSILRRDWDWSA